MFRQVAGLDYAKGKNKEDSDGGEALPDLSELL